MVYKSSSANTQNLSLTIYNDNFAVVKETRDYALQENETIVHYLDVAKKIETDSIIVSGVEVQELNYDFDLVDKAKLLEKYMDHTVLLQDSKTKVKTEYRLLSMSGGLVLENTATKEIVLDPDGEIILPKLPDELIVKPALVWKVGPSNSKSINVSYITKGISWESNYVLKLKCETFDLTGWVEIDNFSGAAFLDAKLKVLAGDVNLAEVGRAYYIEPVVYSLTNMEEQFEEKPFADYHIYTLKGTTTLKDNQKKQIKFIHVENGTFKRYYEFDSYSENPKVMLEIKNSVPNRMGIPLPKGKIKVYQDDPVENSTEFIGEDRIAHTTKDENISLYIGNAFDIVCESKILKRYKMKNFEYEKHEYILKNRKSESVLIKINHYISDRFWKIEESTDEFKLVDTNHIEFWAEVAPEEEKTISFGITCDRSIYMEIKKSDD
ncbi:DUF4139 domain-containing protein [Neobacillus novalis]|uniref:DUF4139 domain-containing protein n=1 Tax=Neobacillus novalis TaxID=220687 RepID=A0AA95MSN7_9BACI|nr:hypothetical protein [Neobacillus novalis]WHY88880.1 DUF4139 domain-containing protein [Neobacillus novalis]